MARNKYSPIFSYIGMRLSSLGTPYAGVPEILHEGLWGRVCVKCLQVNPSKDQCMQHAGKLEGPWCRDMGFPGASTRIIHYKYLAPRSPMNWLSDVDCFGTEDSFNFCARGDWGDVDTSCTNNDYIVACQTGKELHLRFVKRATSRDCSHSL